MNSPPTGEQRVVNRRFQFSLAALLVLVLVCGAVAGLGARWLRDQRRARMATELAAPAAALFYYVPYYEPTVDPFSGEYGRKNLALCVLRRTGHIRGDAPHVGAVLADGLEAYRDGVVRVKTLWEAGVKGGEDRDVSQAMLSLALVEAAIALEQDDADQAGKKLSECVKLAKRKDDEMRQSSIYDKDVVGHLVNGIQVAWIQRIAARHSGDEVGHARALKAQVRLLDDLMARLQGVSDGRQPDPLVEAARLAHAWLRARLAHAAGDNAAETTAWRDATSAAKALRSIPLDGPPPNDPGALFSIHDAYWCGVTHPLLFSEPGLILAEPFHRSQDSAVRVAQQAAMAEYEALCGEAAQRASGSIECPEFWECLHSLARLDQIEAGY